MNAIRISRMIESETLTLHELKPFIGLRMNIVIEEPLSAPAQTGDAAKWDAVLAAAQTLDAYDYEAQSEQDACDRLDAETPGL